MVWRPTTEEESITALGFGRCEALHRNDLAMAMFSKAVEGEDITDKQGNAIRAIARDFRPP